MIYSNERKLCLSGWLKHHHEREYDNPLKLQKFLLLYESLSKVAGEEPDFTHLRGYKRGPVFSNVWGDYTKERALFDVAAEKSYESKKISIDEVRAQKSGFMTATLSERELSELTHKMNLWKSKENRIMSGERQVSLSENDFNAEDVQLISLLDRMYPIAMVESSEVISMNNVYFVFNKSDIPKLTEEHFDILSVLTDKEELHNPVYVDIDEEGRLIID